MSALSPTHTHDPLPMPVVCTRYPRPSPLFVLVDCSTSTLLTVDRKFDQVPFDLFSCPNSIFVVCFSIKNLDMPGDEISRLIHGDNFAQWSQAMCSYLKGSKLWLYVSGDRPIPEKVDKETNSAYAIRIEDWESDNH